MRYVPQYLKTQFLANPSTSGYILAVSMSWRWTVDGINAIEKCRIARHCAAVLSDWMPRFPRFHVVSIDCLIGAWLIEWFPTKLMECSGRLGRSLHPTRLESGLHDCWMNSEICHRHFRWTRHIIIRAFTLELAPGHRWEDPATMHIARWASRTRGTCPTLDPL